MTDTAKGLTRRSFLASTALTAGALATAGMAGCTSVDTSGEAADAAQKQEERTFVNTCRGNCGGQCALQATVREGKLVKTVPMAFPKEQEGILQGCVKGFANPLRVYGTHRITHPLLQTGERGSDNWEQITWDEAIGLIAEKFQAAIDEYGPRSIGISTGWGNSHDFLSGTPTYLTNQVTNLSKGLAVSRFAKKVGATMFGPSGDSAAAYMMFIALQLPSITSETYQHSKTIVLWGTDPVDGNFSKANWHYICKARENGAKVIVINPLYTGAAAQADQWIPLRVGTDSALMCAIVNHLIENGKADFDYLAKQSVAPMLLKEDGSLLRQSDMGVQVAEGETDLPLVHDDATDGFVVYREAAEPALNGTFDFNGERIRTVFEATLENIKGIDVAFAAKECGISEDVIVALAEQLVAEGPTLLAHSEGITRLYNSYRVRINFPFLASVIGCMRELGGGYVAASAPANYAFVKPPAPSMDALGVEDEKPVISITHERLVDIMESGTWNGEEFPVRCLYMQAISQLDNGLAPAAVLEAWNKIDFLVTAEQFMTTSAHYCDLVLPVAMSWESEDFQSTGGFMRQKAIEPLGEAKTDFEIWKLISDAMGLEGVLDKTEEEYLRGYLDTEENLAAGLGYDAYHEKGAISKDGYEPVDAAPPVETNALGVTVFYVENLVPKDTLDVRFTVEDKLPGYTRAIEAYADNPLRETYPLFGLSNHDNYHGQSLFAHNAWLDEFRTLDGSPYCRISEQAARERGIATGDKVRVFNDHGSVVLKALVTNGIQAETVWLPHGFFWDEFEEGHPQFLTGPAMDPQTSNGNTNDFLCEVEKC